MAFNTSSWSVKEEVNKAKLRFEIPNFSDVVGNTTKGQDLGSKQFDVGGSKFALGIYPKGVQQAKKGMMSAFLRNESNHDVEVDFTISVEGGNAKSWENEKIEKNKGRGWKNFMRASEVGTDLKTIVEVKLKWEDISEQNQAERWVMGMEQMGGRLEQRMKTFVLAELDQQQQQMKTFVRGELAKVKPTPIPECPVCFLQLKPPKKIVQCLKVRVYGMELVSQMKIYVRVKTYSCLKYTLYPEGPQDLQAMQREGGSGVLPHLQDCLHGEGLWHGGLRQRAL